MGHDSLPGECLRYAEAGGTTRTALDRGLARVAGLSMVVHVGGTADEGELPPSTIGVLRAMRARGELLASAPGIVVVMAIAPEGARAWAIVTVQRHLGSASVTVVAVAAPALAAVAAPLVAAPAGR